MNILNIQVSKGCGKRQDFESEFGTKGTFNSVTQCFVTNVYNSTQVCNFRDFSKTKFKRDFQGCVPCLCCVL